MLLVKEGFIASIIVASILIVVVTIAIIVIIKDRKKCGCGCSSCPYSASCHKKKDIN